MKSESNILLDIVEYCDEIESDILFYGSDIDSFLEEKRFQRSSEFCLFQIGDKVKSLRSNYGEKYQTAYWKKIAGMRDVIGHGYDSFDHEAIWPILIESIPELKSICEDILSKLNVD